MPRTKMRLKSTISNENIKPTATKLKEENIKKYLKELENEKVRREEIVEAEYKRLMLKVESSLSEMLMMTPRSDLGKTIAELKRTLDLPSSRTLSKSTLIKTSTAEDNQPTLSYNEYTTLSCSRVRVPRASTVIKKSKRASRSLSRSKLRQAAQLNSLKTPAVEAVPTAITCYTVTPKVNPNHPQVIMRRPKIGEMALSMQGSPLMVSSVSSDKMANVNIPLRDGCIYTIQPQRGLRTSQIPHIDQEIQRQIETLRDNLNKVCART